MVESRTRMREMRGDGGNHHQKLGQERMSSSNQFTIPDRVGISHDLAGNHTHTRSSQPNQASRTPDFSYPLIFTTSFSSSSPSLTFFSWTQLASQNTKLSYPGVSHHAMMMTSHWTKRTPRVQHTPSTAYTEYSIHWVQLPLQIVCGPIILMIRSWHLNVARASFVPPSTIDWHQPALREL
jgi:hypothetical protein